MQCSYILRLQDILVPKSNFYPSQLLWSGLHIKCPTSLTNTKLFLLFYLLYFLNSLTWYHNYFLDWPDDGVPAELEGAGCEEGADGDDECDVEHGRPHHAAHP